ncbi:MAG: acyl-CoA thioesterase [Planctomycetaceae bacterium]|nr:acyl-CoA thioesterase [Planctomycetaceae bacterium]
MELLSYFEYCIAVQPEDIDDMNHVNNVCYVRWMQDVAVSHSSANGWTPEKYLAHGFGWVVRKHIVEYLQPACFGDVILVRTAIYDFQTVRSTRRYQFFRQSDGVLLVRAETLWAFVSMKTRRPMKIPPEVADRFIVFDLETLNKTPL